MPVYWDRRAGKLWLEIGRFDTEILHYASLPAGAGPERHRAEPGRPGARGGGGVRARGAQGAHEGAQLPFPGRDHRRRREEGGGRRLSRPRCCGASRSRPRPAAGCWWTPPTSSSATAHGVVETLRRTRQGTFRLDASRSAPLPAAHEGLPEEHRGGGHAHLHLRPARGGWSAASRRDARGPHGARAPLVRGAARPWTGAISRAGLDPRAGYGSVISYMDYAAALDEHAAKRASSAPSAGEEEPDGAAPSEPVEPIVYYLDPGTPEPVRTALLEGGRWWNQAFEAAGYRQRLPHGGAPRHGRPHGRPLQRGPVGAPLHPRVELRQLGRGPAHGGDPQGPRDAGLAAGAPGLPHRRGLLRRTRTGARTRRPSAPWRSSASGSSPPTRSATRWGSPQLHRPAPSGPPGSSPSWTTPSPRIRPCRTGRSAWAVTPTTDGSARGTRSPSATATPTSRRAPT